MTKRHAKRANKRHNTDRTLKGDSATNRGAKCGDSATIRSSTGPITIDGQTADNIGHSSTIGFTLLQGFTANHMPLFGKNFQATAAITHTGASPKSGHYLMKARFGTRWITLDDAKLVQKVENFVQNLKNVRLLSLERK